MHNDFDTYHVLRKICHIKDVTFFNKSYGEWDKVDKRIAVFMDYEGSDDEDIKLVHTIDNVMNSYNV